MKLINYWLVFVICCVASCADTNPDFDPPNSSLPKSEKDLIPIITKQWTVNKGFPYVSFRFLPSNKFEIVRKVDQKFDTIRGSYSYDGIDNVIACQGYTSFVLKDIDKTFLVLDSKKDGEQSLRIHMHETTSQPDPPTPTPPVDTVPPVDSIPVPNPPVDTVPPVDSITVPNPPVDTVPPVDSIPVPNPPDSTGFGDTTKSFKTSFKL